MRKKQEVEEKSDRESVLQMRKACKSARKRIVKKRDKQKKEYEESGKSLWYRQIGDSLLADAAHIKKGTSVCEIKNVHTQNPEPVKLNPKLNAVRNAELLYKKARKGKRGEDACKEKLRASEKELEFIETAIEECNECLLLDETTDECFTRFDDLQKRVRESELIPGLSNLQKSKHDTPKVPYRHFTIEEWHVYVGKNTTQNDELSIKFAKPWDVWCHVAAHAGSHVVLKREKNSPWPPKQIIEKVAALAVWFSKAKHTSYAEVHITEARYVHKRRKSPPGEVVLDTYKTVRVAPKSPQEMFKK